MSKGEKKRRDGKNIKRRILFISELAVGPASLALMGEFGSVDAGISSWKSLRPGSIFHVRSRFFHVFFYTHTHTHTHSLERRKDTGERKRRRINGKREKRTQSFLEETDGQGGRKKTSRRISVFGYFVFLFVCFAVVFLLFFLPVYYIIGDTKLYARHFQIFPVIIINLNIS